MRARKVMNLAVIMLAGLFVAGVAWGATCADVRRDVATNHPDYPSPIAWIKYRVWEPFIMSGPRIVRLSDVCVEGSTVRVKATGESMGEVRPSYYVHIMGIGPVGNDVFIENREVTLPACQVVGSAAPRAN